MFASDAQMAGDQTFVRSVRNDPWEQWRIPPLTASNDNSPLPKIVALAGAAGSGKSTAADFLIANHGYTRLKFAGPLKAMCRALGMTDEMLEGADKETPQDWLCGRSPRYVMQRLGTEWGRNLIGPDFWTVLFRKAANDVITAGGRVVVDDCRFDNEAFAVKSMGGLVVKLEGRGGVAAAHTSEKITDEVDAVVHNNGSIPELFDRMRETLLARY